MILKIRAVKVFPFTCPEQVVLPALISHTDGNVLSILTFIHGPRAGKQYLHDFIIGIIVSS